MDRQTCVGCGRESPPTETNYTLISSQFGWRLTRAKTDNGIVVEWRCPSCWREYKRKRPGTVTGGMEDRTTMPPPPAPRVSEPPPGPSASRLVAAPEKRPATPARRRST